MAEQQKRLNTFISAETFKRVKLWAAEHETTLGAAVDALLSRSFTTRSTFEKLTSAAPKIKPEDWPEAIEKGRKALVEAVGVMAEHDRAANERGLGLSPEKKRYTHLKSDFDRATHRFDIP